MLSAKALSDLVADWQRSNQVVVNTRERGIALRISNLKFAVALRHPVVNPRLDNKRIGPRV